MHIRKLTIERFRGIERLEVFPGDANVILGPNNAGKSTVLHALDTLFHPGFGRPRLIPRETDFLNRDPSQGFMIEAVLTDLQDEFTGEIPDHLEGWDKTNRIVVPEPGGDNTDPAVVVRARATSEMTLHHEFSKTESQGALFRPGLRALVGWVFDARIRDPSWHLSFYQGGVLDRLFSDIDLTSCTDALRHALAEGTGVINQDPSVEPMLTSLGDDLRDLGLLDEKEQPQFETGAVTQREILQTLRLSLPSGGAQIPLSLHGRGIQRLLLISALLRLSKANAAKIIGAFEEPEEALEPLRQAQIADLLKGVSRDGGQLFVVTHSPQIVRAFEIDEFLLIQEHGPPIHLRDTVSPPIRQAYERRVDGPVVRGLFSRIPMLVEGPGDRAVLDVFWSSLFDSGRVQSQATIGLEFINCEGVPHMPMMAALLASAGKPVVALAELDTDSVRSVIEKLRAENNCAAFLIYDKEQATNLELALALGCPISSLCVGMTEVANDRSYSWDAQKEDLISRSDHVEQQDRENMKASDDLDGLLNCLSKGDARSLIAKALGSKTTSPFDLKGARQARIFAGAIVKASGVPTIFGDGLTSIGEWVAKSCPVGTEVRMSP